MSRRVVHVAAIALIAGPAEARRDRNLSGDVARAAKLMNASRLDEARVQIDELARRAPGTAEVRWLEAQLAFLGPVNFVKFMFSC